MEPTHSNTGREAAPWLEAPMLIACDSLFENGLKGGLEHEKIQDLICNRLWKYLNIISNCSALCFLSLSFESVDSSAIQMFPFFNTCTLSNLTTGQEAITKASTTLKGKITPGTHLPEGMDEGNQWDFMLTLALIYRTKSNFKKYATTLKNKF